MQNHWKPRKTNCKTVGNHRKPFIGVGLVWYLPVISQKANSAFHNLRELPALPQGRWFTCALGRGSDGDGLTYLVPESVFDDSFKDLKPPGSKMQNCRFLMPGCAPQPRPRLKD